MALKRRFARRWAMGTLVASCGLAIAAAAGLGLLWPGPVPARGANARAVPASAVSARAVPSFVSRYPISDASEIDRYSLTSGRRLGVLAGLPAFPSKAQNSYVSNPHLLTNGDYLITFAHNAECGSTGGQCRPRANTCASRIERIDPATGDATLLFTESGAWQVFDAVPSPSNRYVAFVEQACGGNSGRLMVHDLQTGRQHVAARNLSDCALSSSATWTKDGAKLVFAFARHPHPNNPGANCSLATAPAGRTTASSSWPLMRPDASCGFESSALDRGGLVAAETCAPTKDSKLIQYASTGRIVRRLSLAPWDYGVATTVTADQRANTVLVSQIVNSQPDVTTVWTFNGTKLHVVNVYFGAAIVAEP